jgi:hypothetical protein
MDTLSRSELKYALPTWRVSALRADLKALLTADPNNQRLPGAGQGYVVRSLYFDSPGLIAFHEKLSGVHTRCKLRVRGYPPFAPDDFLVLELKRKLGSAIVKHRTRLSPDELKLIISGRYSALLTRRPDDTVLRSFISAKAQLGAVVPILIEYRREAYTHRDPSVYVRATIDTQLRAAHTARFFNPSPSLKRLRPSLAILELKTDQGPPDWLPMLAARYDLRPAALSKYELATEHTLQFSSF